MDGRLKVVYASIDNEADVVLRTSMEDGSKRISLKTVSFRAEVS